MYDVGKNTQEHPRDAVFQKHFSVTEGEIWRGSTKEAVQEERSCSCGQQKEELCLTGNLASSSLHPLVSLRELLASVYVLGDKTQTRNGNGSEQGCVRGCAGSGRL